MNPSQAKDVLIEYITDKIGAVSKNQLGAVV